MKKISTRCLTPLTLAVGLVFASTTFAGTDVAPRAKLNSAPGSSGKTPDKPLPVILPYLQNPAPDGMTICFASTQAGGVRVAWAPEGESTLKEVPAVATAISKMPWTIWKARLGGLKPGASYTYRMRYQLNGKEIEEQAHVFRTLNPDAPSLKMILFNDLHGTTNAVHALMGRVKPDDFELTVLLGDIWDKVYSRDSAREVFSVFGDYVRSFNASEKPMVFVIGNHDRRGDFKKEVGKLFDSPYLDTAAALYDQRYEFDFQAGPVWVLHMDTGQEGRELPKVFRDVRERQKNWLKERFAAGAGRHAPWHILVSHMPLYAQSDPNYPGCITYADPSRAAWEPVLAEVGIDLMMCGHNHGYPTYLKGQTITNTYNPEDAGNKIIGMTGPTTFTITPPYPVLIGGGGHTVAEGRVMLFEASAGHLHVRLIDSAGKVYSEINQDKPTPFTPLRN